MSNPVQEFGVGFLQFDAGGSGSAVSPNPLQSGFDPDDHAFIKIEWVLTEEIHLFSPEWRVIIGNIVPCVIANITTAPERFESASRQEGKRWIWRWPLADLPPSAMEVAYEIFFDYGPASPPVPIPLRPTVRGRLGMHSVDPTLLLPPKG